MHSETAQTSLRATRISVGLRPILDGIGAPRGVLHVVSVHRAVINIRPEDGPLIAIADEAVGGLPNGILLGDDPDLPSLGIRPGMAARWVTGRLHIPAASLVVQTDGAAEWSPALARRDVRHWPLRSARARILARDARVPGGLLALPMAWTSLWALDRAIRNGDRAAAGSAAHGLIGLGPGLTPSGDDALAGVESALHAADHPASGFLGAALHDVSAIASARRNCATRAAGRVRAKASCPSDGSTP